MLHKNDNEMTCNLDGMELIDHLLSVLSISPTVKSKPWNNFIFIFMQHWGNVIKKLKVYFNANGWDVFLPDWVYTH